MRTHHMRKMLKYLSLLSAILLAVVMFGCEGDKGDNGTSSGTLTGTVTDTATNPNKIGNVTVTPSPAVNGVTPAVTDSSGNYKLTLPIGNYTLTYSKQGYTTQTQNASVIAGQTTTLPTIALVQTAAAVVNVSNAQFGNNTTAKVTATVLVNDPALQGQPASIVWKDATTGAVIGTGPTITVHKPNSATQVAAVAEFAKVRQSVYPPGFNPIADENGFDVPDFETLDRLQVLPIDQFAFEEAANAPFKAVAQVGPSTFNTFSSAFVATSPLNQLPFVPNGGIRNVPVGQPVVLQGSITKADNTTAQSTWSWTIAAPTGSGIRTLLDPTTRFPHFIPDAPGTYVITETVSGRAPIKIYAAKYVGMLNPAPNNDPLGIVDVSCSNTSCHSTTQGSSFFATPYLNSTPATPVQFFDTTVINNVFNNWTSSGHRHIMVKGMQEGSHYSLNRCAKCHSVGWSQYSSVIKSDGFKDIANATGFTDATFLANAPNFFVGFDQVLRKSEVQCETCHGPNGDGGAHNNAPSADTIGARMSVSSDVCGTCHGEPPRHGRYNEWRVSGHGDFETAMGEGVTGVNAANPIGTGPNTSCAGCHSGQGFPIFLAQLQGTNGNTANPNRTITNRPAPGPQNAAFLSFLRTDNVQPQTCSTCHPVHNPGKQPGLVGDIVILRGDYQPGGAFDGFTPLLPGGFQANGVGKGALCITCHNSRNGGVGAFELAKVSLHEDGDPSFALVGTPATATPTTPVLGYSAPHEACQGDVLMGHNAYFFGGPEDTRGTFKALPAQLGQRSRHASLTDACVTCHLQKAPPDPSLGYPPDIAGAGTNHTFNIVSNPNVPAGDQINALCSQCHGGLSGTGVQSTFDTTYKQALIATGNAILRMKFGTTAAIPAGTTLTFIPGRSPQVSVNGAAPVTLASYMTGAPGTTNSGTPNAGGVQLDLAKANWDLSLVAPKYNATQLNGSSYDNGSPIAGNPVQVAGDQSKSVHNPSFVNNVLNVVTIRMNSL